MRATITALSSFLLIGITGSQSATQTFVIRAYSDTVAVEHLTRSGNTVTGDLQLFVERTNVHYVLHLRADGTTESADVIDEAPNFFTGRVAFGSPSASVRQSGSRGRLVRVSEDLLPVIGTSMGLIDYLIRVSRPAQGESVEIKVVNIRNGTSGRVTIKRFTEDSALVDCDGCMRQRVTEELRVGLSPDGGIDGAVRVEQHWTVARR